MTKTLTLDEILNNFRQSSIIIHAQGSVRGVDEDVRAFKQSMEDANQEILQWVADDVVGKDDWHGDRVNGYQRNTVDTVRNKHRDEQRQILKDHGWKG